MPERWQRELEKLDLLEPGSPPSGWEAARGRRTSRSPRGQKVRAMVVSAGLVTAAGYFLWSALGPTEHRPSTGSGDSEEVPDVAVVTCSRDGTAVASPEVKVQADGLHFRVENDSGEDEVFIVGVDPITSRWAADIDLSQATAHVDDRLPPGDWRVGCFSDEDVRPTAIEELRELEGLAALRFVDPEGLYVSPELSCEESHTLEWTYPREKGDWDSTEEFLRAALPGVLADDEIQHAGYPESEPYQYEFRIVREGLVVAHINDVVAGGVAPRNSEVRACKGSGIGEEIA